MALEQLEPLILQLILLMEEEEDDYEQLMMAVARIAAQEIMEMEEGILIGQLTSLTVGRLTSECHYHYCFSLSENFGETWFYFTVNINEYHTLGEPCFKMHFRMSRAVFEASISSTNSKSTFSWFYIITFKFFLVLGSGSHRASAFGRKGPTSEGKKTLH